MALAVDTTYLQKMFLFLCIGAHALGFVGKVCSTNVDLVLCSRSTHVYALSQFLLYIFLLSPAELVWSQVIKQLCEANRGSPSHVVAE
jgi:hypothetical protein